MAPSIAEEAYLDGYSDGLVDVSDGGGTGVLADLGIEEEGDLEDALRRNLYRGDAPSADALAHVEGALRARWTRLACLTRDALLAGDLG